MASRSPLTAVSDANVPTEMDVEPSKLVQRVRGYEIMSQLGDGAYGTVYTARDFNGSIVALKLIEYPPKDTDMAPATRLCIPRCSGLLAGTPGYMAVVSWLGPL